MNTRIRLPFMTLILLISFASVNAVLFTPALPDLAAYFAISDEAAQHTVSWFLVGYALGQLFYGPLASRFGRKAAILLGIGLQILASVGCMLAGLVESYPLLVICRFLLALGSGVGLKMTFTLVNECYEPKIASQKISYLMLAFAVTPGLSVALGGILNTYFGWMACFAAGAIYGFILLLLTLRLPHIPSQIDVNALKVAHLTNAYKTQFSNKYLLVGGLLMGAATCFVYIFAALAPFIAMNMMGMSSEEYGYANLLPSIGMVVGAIASSQCIKKYTMTKLIEMGIIIAAIGVLWMLTAVLLDFSAMMSLFLPMTLIYMGLSLVLPNASTYAMSHVTDKAHGSAVMNFINMGSATVMVLSLGWFSTHIILLPAIFLMLCAAMVPMYYMIK